MRRRRSPATTAKSRHLRGCRGCWKSFPSPTYPERGEVERSDDAGAEALGIRREERLLALTRTGGAPMLVATPMAGVPWLSAHAAVSAAIVSDLPVPAGPMRASASSPRVRSRAEIEGRRRRDASPRHRRLREMRRRGRERMRRRETTARPTTRARRAQQPATWPGPPRGRTTRATRTPAALRRSARRRTSGAPPRWCRATLLRAGPPRRTRPGPPPPRPRPPRSPLELPRERLQGAEPARLHRADR